RIFVFQRSYVSKNEPRSRPSWPHSRRSSLNQRAAVIRSRAVSKISLNRRRTLYSGLSAGIFSKRASNACFSSALKLSGSRRKAHIWDRKAFRWSLVSFALYSRVIFFRKLSTTSLNFLATWNRSVTARVWGNLLRRAADQRAEHELLEAISVGYVLAFERGDNVLPVVTPRTAMEGSLVNPETGLLPQVEVPDRLGDCFELDVGDVVVATFFTTASCGQGPPHLQAMAVLIPLVTGDFHLGRKVDIDGDPSHGPSVIRDVS